MHSNFMTILLTVFVFVIGYWIIPVFFLMILRAMMNKVKKETPAIVINSIIKRYNYYLIAFLPFFVAGFIYLIFTNIRYLNFIFPIVSFISTIVILIFFWIPKQKYEFKEIQDPVAEEAVEVLYGPKGQNIRIGRLLLLVGIILFIPGIATFYYQIKSPIQYGCLISTGFLLVSVIFIILSIYFFKKYANKNDNSKTDGSKFVS